MTRDQKIGLALGILLVGAVAAFFYRHEPPPVTPLPELKTAAELDQQISEKPMAPYVEPRTPSAEASKSPGSSDPFADQEAGGLVPEPIAMDPVITNDPATKLASATAVKPLSPSQASAALTEARHFVQRGDTLSSIAAKYLGSSARFQEIYDANRDRLRDANDLRIGQELKIPSRATWAPPVVETPSMTTPPSADGEATVPSSKFVPHPGPRAAPRTTAPTASSGGKRLSQVPPDDQVIRR